MSGPTYTRRQAYAQFLLFGDPVSLRPSPVGLVDMLIIDLEDLAELARWKRAFLGDNLSHEGLLDDAEPGQLIAYADGTWAGWPLRFTVHAPERQDDVDELAADAIRSKLQQLVDEARTPLQQMIDGTLPVQAEIRAQLADEAEAAREAGDESRFLHDHGVDELVAEDES